MPRRRPLTEDEKQHLRNVISQKRQVNTRLFRAKQLSSPRSSPARLRHQLAQFGYNLNLDPTAPSAWTTVPLSTLQDPEDANLLLTISHQVLRFPRAVPQLPIPASQPSRRAQFEDPHPLAPFVYHINTAGLLLSDFSPALPALKPRPSEFFSFAIQRELTQYDLTRTDPHHIAYLNKVNAVEKSCRPPVHAYHEFLYYTSVIDMCPPPPSQSHQPDEPGIGFHIVTYFSKTFQQALHTHRSLCIRYARRSFVRIIKGTPALIFPPTTPTSPVNDGGPPDPDFQLVYSTGIPAMYAPRTEFLGRSAGYANLKPGASTKSTPQPEPSPDVELVEEGDLAELINRLESQPPPSSKQIEEFEAVDRFRREMADEVGNAIRDLDL